jgi:two-component system sensor histidine kinase YesM
VLIGLVASLMTIGISFNYLKQKRKALEVRNKMEKDFLELRLSAIHARMNPHFIFNTLNGIKYYLSANKEEEAEEPLVLA